MGYHISDIPNLKIIEVTVEGLLDPESRQRILAKSIFKLINASYDKLMIDIVNTCSPLNQSMHEALYLTSFMKTAGFHEALRLAFIYRNDENLRLYFESNALAQGFQVRYFKNRENAIAWLCE